MSFGPCFQACEGRMANRLSPSLTGTGKTHRGPEARALGQARPLNRGQLSTGWRERLMPRAPIGLRPSPWMEMHRAFVCGSESDSLLNSVLTP